MGITSNTPRLAPHSTNIINLNKPNRLFPPLFSFPTGPNYFEVDVDITSNTVANSVTSLVVGAITSLVVDLAPLVEGQVGGARCGRGPLLCCGGGGRFRWRSAPGGDGRAGRRFGAAAAARRALRTSPSLFPPPACPIPGG